MDARSPASGRRIGSEVEFLDLSAESGRPVPVDGDEALSSVAFLRRYSAAREWAEDLSPIGSPRFRKPPIERVPLQIRSDRYVRMTEYFERIGPAGVRMMRQTAAFHVNVDLEDEPLERFRLLNSAAPYLIAAFAHSPVYAGAPTAHRSHRAHVWRETDPRRTGVLAGADGPAAYLDFCLKAPAILKGPLDGTYPTFGERVDRGEATLDDWRRHLMNLYPEVRPRGYLEVRSPDAVDPEWFAAPIALVAGLVYDRESARAALELLGPPDPERLRRAGELGLGDPAIASVARDLFQIGLAGCAALGPRFIAPAEPRRPAHQVTRHRPEQEHDRQQNGLRRLHRPEEKRNRVVMEAPTRSSTRRCLETAGREIGNGRASSPPDVSPRVRRASQDLE